LSAITGTTASSATPIPRTPTNHNACPLVRSTRGDGAEEVDGAVVGEVGTELGTGLDGEVDGGVGDGVVGKVGLGEEKLAHCEISFVDRGKHVAAHPSPAPGTSSTEKSLHSSINERPPRLDPLLGSVEGAPR
jgi:hypothetical protein